MADTENKIMQSAERLHRIVEKDFVQWIENIRNCWEGDSAELLIEKCLILRDSMSETEKELREISEEHWE